MVTTAAFSRLATSRSAAACDVGLIVVRRVPGVPSARVTSVLSGVCSLFLPLSLWTTRSSMPAVPPAFLPYFSRSPSMTVPSEGYLAAVSSFPSRSVALIGGSPAAPVTSRSPSLRSGCTTDACHPTSGLPSFTRRTTVSSEP